MVILADQEGLQGVAAPSLLVAQVVDAHHHTTHGVTGWRLQCWHGGVDYCGRKP